MLSLKQLAIDDKKNYTKEKDSKKRVKLLIFFFFLGISAVSIGGSKELKKTRIPVIY